MHKIFFTLLLLPTLLTCSTYLRAEPIVLSLHVSAIDFGDVYTDSEVGHVLVDFTVKAENSRPYRVEVSSNDSSSVIEFSRTASRAYTANNITYTATGTGNNQLHEFYVDPKTMNINSDLSAKITVQVAYTDN